MTANRREFLQGAAVGGLGLAAAPGIGRERVVEAGGAGAHRSFNGSYAGEHLNRIAFPMGGIGAGMICLEGTGALAQFSLRNRPDLASQPLVFAALSIKGEQGLARVLEGPVPAWKLFPGGPDAGGLSPHSGLPRFASASFEARFPFAHVSLVDEHIPIEVRITGWSPFEPGDADNASLPVAALEYTFTNRSRTRVDGVFSFNAANFLFVPHLSAEKRWPSNAIRATPGGFILQGAGASGEQWEECSLAAWVDEPNARVNHAWHRSFGNPLAKVWRDIESGACYDRPPLVENSAAPGASLSVPFSLELNASKRVPLRLAWYCGTSRMRTAGGELFAFNTLNDGKPTYQPWYAGRFANINELIAYWQHQYDTLRSAAERFSTSFYSSTLPPEVIEAVAATLSILKSPTVLRQADGRLWAWEGTGDTDGMVPGSCTHVWNYAQAIAHLFPALERTLRETEFEVSQRSDGHQAFRAALPIRKPETTPPFAAADGQLGGIMKIHRDWRISGDTEWLRRLWPKVRASLDYCIRTWDPRREGWLTEPQHTTYDSWFWGPNGMTTSFYLGALKAATLMGSALQEDISGYAQLFERGVARIETELFDGEYFYQRIRWRDLNAKYPEYYRAELSASVPPEVLALITAPEVLALAGKEGPPDQYGTGCLSDGALGAWMAWVCGVGETLNRGQVTSHVQAVLRHNFRRDLATHANLRRSSFAGAGEGGLLLCTWPKGDALSVPMMYSGEVWTGVEYQMASHMISLGLVEQGLELVRTSRARYDGRVRNPFDQMEAGHWYARALSSYALLQACSGASYDAVRKVLYLQPAVAGDFRCFLATDGGYGVVGVRQGKPFLEVVSGRIDYDRLEYTPA